MRRTSAPHRRRPALPLAALTLLAACSSGAAESTDPTTPATAATSTTTPTSGPARVGPAAPDDQPAIAAKAAAVDEVPATTLPPEPARVSVDVAVGPSTTVLAGQAARDGAADPFGEFATCSGLHDTVAAWSLVVSDPTAEMTAVSLLTEQPIGGPGAYPAVFRVEWVNGASLDATGTITLAGGLQSGSFVADDADLRGTFECTGAPTPAALGEGAVTAVALLQRGARQRIVSLAAPADGSANRCAADGSVALTGDAGLGAPVAVSIAPSGAASVRVGDQPLPIDLAASEIVVAAGSGIVHLRTADGTTIDAAYRCP